MEEVALVVGVAAPLVVAALEAVAAAVEVVAVEHLEVAVDQEEAVVVAAEADPKLSSLSLIVTKVCLSLVVRKTLLLP